MGQADTLIAIEKSQVGYRENNGSSNHNNLQKYSNEVPGLEWSQNQAWCMTFQSWCLRKAGIAPLGPVTASTATGYQWYASRGRASFYPAVGALVFFGPGAGSHVGMVWKYDANTIWTIEGNTNDNGSAEGDGVYSKTRQRRDTYVYGYGYPAFSEGIVTADPSHAVAGSRYAATASSGAVATPPVSTVKLPQISYVQVAWAANHSTADEKRVKAGPLNPQDDVAKVQAALVKKGMLVAGSFENGFFDVPTETAYAKYQKTLGYTGSDADGKPGPTSLAKLGSGLFEVVSTDVAYNPELTPVVTPPVVVPPPVVPPVVVPAVFWVSYNQVLWAASNNIDAEKAQKPGPANSTDDVAKVQEGLTKMVGFDPGAESGGFYGGLTVAAYKLWQEKLGFTGDDADGIPGQDSLTKLGAQSKLFSVRDFPTDAVSGSVSTAGKINPSQVLYTRYYGTTDAATVIKAGCAAAGVPYNSYWLNGYTTARARESGGDPNAANLYDSNAINPAGYGSVHDYGNNGTFGPALGGKLTPFQCSRGMWQCIPQTFAAYHAPGTSLSIYDAVASCAASIKYVRANYGVSADGSNLASRVQQFDPNRSPRGY